MILALSAGGAGPSTGSGTGAARASREAQAGVSIGYPHWIDQVEPTFEVGSTWMAALAG